MSYKVRLKLSRGLFRIFRHLAPTPEERYMQFGLRMFIKNEMWPGFDWKKYVRVENPYFKKWGFKIPQLDAEYYSQVSGIRADHYVSRTMAYHYIYPFLDRTDFMTAYADKNVQKRLLGLPCAEVDVLMPENIITNSNGVYYDGEGRLISESEAADILTGYGKDTILKQTVDTFGGHSIRKVEGGVSSEEYMDLFRLYHSDFTFQKVVEQHPTFARFNSTSVNTVRIVTYRKPDRSLKILYACIRYGGKGSVMDNICSGGSFSGVDIETGKFTDRKQYTYYVMKAPMMPDDFPEEIPCWDKLKSTAIALHQRLPQMDIIGWDLTLTPDETPLLLEFNPVPGIGLQQAVGPMFSKEDLDELMRMISRIKVEFSPLGILSYPDKPRYYSPTLRCGGRG